MLVVGLRSRLMSRLKTVMVPSEVHWQPGVEPLCLGLRVRDQLKLEPLPQVPASLMLCIAARVPGDERWGGR